MEMDEATRQFVMWVRRESRALAHEWPMGGAAEEEMLRRWSRLRPKMMAELLRLGIAKQLAHVLENRRAEAVKRYLKAGMYLSDAREQAERDWLLNEPESDESPLPFELTTSSPTRKR